jgi:hypothetical protein
MGVGVFFFCALGALGGWGFFFGLAFLIFFCALGALGGWLTLHRCEKKLSVGLLSLCFALWALWEVSREDASQGCKIASMSGFFLEKRLFVSAAHFEPGPEVLSQKFKISTLRLSDIGMFPFLVVSGFRIIILLIFWLRKC